MSGPAASTAAAAAWRSRPPQLGSPASFRPDIEGLRGVAVLLVVLTHLTGWPPGGFVGVDVFFVISGYLITGLLVTELERSGRVRLGHFYLRRARRLLPAGVLVLVVTDAAATLLLMPSRAHSTVLDSLWALGFLANTHFAALGTDYFSLSRAPSAVQHYWSLAVEEQFYALWPALVLASYAVAARWRASGRTVLAVTVGVVLAGSLSWSVVSTARSPAAAYFSAPARAWELGAGALLLLASPRLVPALAWLGGAGLVASVWAITPATAVPGYALALPALSTVAILGAGGARLGLTTRPVRYVGRISYSLYLWHWPCIVLGAAVPGGRSPTGKAAVLGLAVVLAAVTARLVERPFRVARPHAAVLRVAAPALALAVAVVFTALWTDTEPGAGARSGSTAALAARTAAGPGGSAPVGPPVILDAPAAVQAGLAATAWPAGLDGMLVDAAAPEWLRDRCLDVSAKNAVRCVYGPPDAVRTVAVLGDSDAVSWMPGLRFAAAQQHVRLHLLTRRQCPNLLGEVSAHCADHQAWALEQVRLLRPDLVLLSARYEGSPTPAQWFTGTTRMIAAVAPYTAKVVVLAAPPETADLQSCFTRHSQPADCVVRLSSRWLAYSAAERRAAAGAAKFVDPRSWFCLDGRCPAVIAGVPVMFDGRHLTAAYAARLGPELESVLG